MKPSWKVNPDFFDTPVSVSREVRKPAGDGAYTTTPQVVGRRMAQIQDPSLVAASDQQGRFGVDLRRTVYLPVGSDVKPGDVLVTGDLRLTVHSAADRSGLYRKCLTVEEHGT